MPRKKGVVNRGLEQEDDRPKGTNRETDEIEERGRFPGSIDERELQEGLTVGNIKRNVDNIFSDIDRSLRVEGADERADNLQQFGNQFQRTKQKKRFKKRTMIIIGVVGSLIVVAVILTALFLTEPWEK